MKSLHQTNENPEKKLFCALRFFLSNKHIVRLQGKSKLQLLENVLENINTIH